MRTFRQIMFVALPGVAVSILFAICLGHRSDYLGHYSAGLGGTLGATVLLLAVLPSDRYGRWSGPLVLVTSLVCIAIGAGTESTIFRLAKFDEIDFCNQSLGAVVASLSCLAAWNEKPGLPAVMAGCAVALGFLISGFHHAFAA